MDSDPEYFAYVKKQFLDVGVIVPYINNDACEYLAYNSRTT